MKDYIFIFEDIEGNELQRKTLFCVDELEAQNIAFQLHQNTMLNDCTNVRFLS